MVSFKKRGQAQHLATKKHKALIAAKLVNPAVVPAPVVPAHPEEAVAARLSFAERFNVSDSDSEDHEDIYAHADPFDEVDVINNHYFDAAGDEIEFLAGEFASDARVRTGIHKQMDNLEHYEHSLLGEEDGDPQMIMRDSSGTGDPTITDAIAELQAMGKLRNIPWMK